LNQHHLIG